MGELAADGLPVTTRFAGVVRKDRCKARQHRSAKSAPACDWQARRSRHRFDGSGRGIRIARRDRRAPDWITAHADHDIRFDLTQQARRAERDRRPACSDSSSLGRPRPTMPSKAIRCSRKMSRHQRLLHAAGRASQLTRQPRSRMARATPGPGKCGRRCRPPSSADAAADVFARSRRSYLVEPPLQTAVFPVDAQQYGQRDQVGNHAAAAV